MIVTLPTWLLWTLCGLGYLGTIGVAWGLWYRYFVWRGYGKDCATECSDSPCSKCLAGMAAAFWPVSWVVVTAFWLVKGTFIAVKTIGVKVAGRSYE